MSLCEVISHCSAGVGSKYVIVWFFTLVEVAFFAKNI
jgi:protein tyrosine phosphatase